MKTIAIEKKIDVVSGYLRQPAERYSSTSPDFIAVAR